MVATVKVYANQNYAYGYIENDRICGHDSYRASKSAAGMVIGSWRSRFRGTPIHQRPHLAIAPALVAWPAVPVRRPRATRPWQHLLEPLCCYLQLVERLAQSTGHPDVNPCGIPHRLLLRLDSRLQ
jgi:CDP-glucose 4,6-dehydratase